MTPLKNGRQEKFAQAIAAGRTQAEAYSLAGYEGQPGAMDAHASRLVRNGKVSARIAELQQRTAKKAEITLEGLLDEASDIQRAAFESGQFAAANSALKLKAELSGYYVQRKEEVTPRRSSEQIDSRIRQLLAAHDARTEH
jgi:hypothetical protein